MAKAEALFCSGDLIADEYIKFTTILRERQEYLGLWENRIWCTENFTSKNFFEVAFGIRGQDGRIYPFILVLYHLWNHSYRHGEDLGCFIKLIPPDEEKFPVNVNGEIVMNGQTLNNRCGDYGICVDSYEWEKSLLSPCEIEVKIKIFGVQTQNFCQEITMPDWLFSKDKIALISCQDSQNEDPSFSKCFSDLEKGIFTINGYKEYVVDQELMIKQSPVLAKMISSKSQEKSKKVILTDVNCVTFEAYLEFCKTGFVQMSAIDEKMASFVYTYKTENLRHVLDKHVSMILNKENLHTWIDIAAKLELKNTALAIINLQDQSETKMYEGKNKKFANITYRIQSTKGYPAYGKFQKLSPSKNIMIN